jgi:hypothetical protein
MASAGSSPLEALRRIPPTKITSRSGQTTGDAPVHQTLTAGEGDYTFMVSATAMGICRRPPVARSAVPGFGLAERVVSLPPPTDGTTPALPSA